MSDVHPPVCCIRRPLSSRTTAVNQATPTATISRSSSIASGLLSAAAALGVGELTGGAVSNWQSPVVGVATAIIDRVPRSVKEFGIRRFGTNDKLALIIGILVLSVLFGAVLGLVARRRQAVAMCGFAAFALVGVWGSQHAITSTVSGIIPSILAGAAGIGSLWFLVRVAAGHPAVAAETGADVVALDEGAPAMVVPTTRTRRSFLAAGAGLAVVAGATAAGGRALRSRFSVAATRRSITLPAPAKPLAQAPSAVMSDVPGVSSFYTTNADFYRIDTAVEVPQINPDSWELRIHGMVDREIRISYADLLKRPMIEEDITLTCVSNTVGGHLLGTARWLGASLKDLLAEAGVHPDADQIVGRSIDGWTSGFPLESLDGRPALLAVGMNGEPLPLEHGFPVRVIVAGLYGYVSATKWITEIEVTRFDAYDAYWVKRGWSDRGPIKTQSRIDTPRVLANVAPGTVNIGGVAWDQAVGISKVEVKIDDGEFAVATLADQLTINTWRLWSMQWTGATTGRHRITVRATDANGVVQTDERADPFPNGASGWMSIFVNVGG